MKIQRYFWLLILLTCACTRALPEPQVEQEIISASNSAQLAAVRSVEASESVENELRRAEALLLDAHSLVSRSEKSLQNCQTLTKKMKGLSARIRREKAKKKKAKPVQIIETPFYGEGAQPDSQGKFPPYSPSDAPKIAPQKNPAGS